MPKGIYKRTAYQRKLASEKLKKFRIVKKGSEHYRWTGDKFTYRTIHKWIETHYGKPTTCEHCQTTNLSGRYIHWATKSLPYTRDRENWLRLCAKCHALYDKINNLRRRKK